MAVLPSAAGRGVGKSLITFCEDAGRQLGMNAMHLAACGMQPNIARLHQRGVNDPYLRVVFHAFNPTLLADA